MQPQLQYLVLLALSPLFMFLLHMATGRLYMALKLEKASPLVSAIWAIGLGVVLIAVLSWRLFLGSLNGGEQIVAILYGALVLIFLSGAYYILFAMTEAARRIKILQEIYRKGQMTAEEMNRIYGSDSLFSIRIERLLALNQIEKKDDRYYLKGNGLYAVAFLVSFWSRILKFSKN